MNEKQKSSIWSAGKVIICFLGLYTACSPFVADWNKTHIYNPYWPPHAKFHNAQTMALGALLGAWTFSRMILKTNIDEIIRLRESCLLVSLYWIAQFLSLLFPGTALSDPNSGTSFPHLFGFEINQLVINTLLVFPLIFIGYRLELKRISSMVIA